MSALQDVQAAIGLAVDRVGPAVVGTGHGWRPGSGVVVERGRVLAASHNLRGGEATLTFGDGRSVPASVTGLDPKLDIALLSADTGDIAPVEWEPDGAGLTVGAPVIALANPGGQGLRATLGFVSATDRGFRGPRGRRITGCIEHTAPLPHGSAGGPLVDPDGRLLGLNAVRMAGGLILALPADSGLRQRADALWRGEARAPLRLGVAVAAPYVARRLRRAVGLPEAEGVLVRRVESASAAERAGIETGDLIVAAGNRTIDGVDALYESLDQVEPGGSLELKVLRGSEQKELTVSFEESQEQEKVKQ